MINICVVCKLGIKHRDKIVVISPAIADYNCFQGYVKTYMVEDEFCHIDCIDKQFTKGGKQ